MFNYAHMVFKVIQRWNTLYKQTCSVPASDVHKSVTLWDFSSGKLQLPWFISWLFIHDRVSVHLEHECRNTLYFSFYWWRKGGYMHLQLKPIFLENKAHYGCLKM